jgi:nucleoside diphosphate kinase
MYSIRELAYDMLHFSLLQELARKLRPNTLRARFGKTKVQNAVHCTDLPEDGLLEVISSVC